MKKDSNRTNNGYFSIVTLCCLLVSSSLAMASHQQQAATELFDLINQRLSYMEDVALYKAQHNIAIEDRNRETIVITEASQAATLSGIEAITAERFFGAQISAAKAIQNQVLKTYSEQQIAQATPGDLGKQIRPALISLGEAILRKASDYLVRYGTISADQYRLFNQQVENKYLKRNPRQSLFDALCQLRLSKSLPPGFVDVKAVSPNIQLELRYFSSHNFVGAVVDGYFAKRLILSQPAGNALASVQAELETFNLGLLVYDGYRPQRAVDHFVRWAGDLNDTKTKSEFYPDVAKSMLFEQGYIASRSGHTRGSTVDLTIVQALAHGAMPGVSDTIKQYEPIDMGSPYDFFGVISWPDDSSITAQQRVNRMLLKTLMVKHGFKPYAKEWWHFTMNDEPYPDTYFDFPIVTE